MRGRGITAGETPEVWTAATEAARLRPMIRNGDKERYQALTTAKNAATAELKQNRTLPGNRVRLSKEIDRALPGRHTKDIYDQLWKAEARILAQLRTGMSRLNDYLYKIGAEETAECACGAGREDA